MDNFNLKKYLAEGKIFEEDFKYTEENPYIATMVGGDTGVNLPMRKIFKMLKDANYNPRITKGNKLTGISDIEIGVGDDNFSAGLLLITKNGQTFGDDLWGKDIKSETEIFPLIDEYYKSQLEAEKEREESGYYDLKERINMKELNAFRQYLTEGTINEYDSQLERGQDYEVHEPGMDEWHDLEYIGFDRNEDEHIFMDTVNISPGSNEIYIIKIPNGELMSSVRGLDSQPHKSEEFDAKFKGTTPDDIDF